MSKQESFDKLCYDIKTDPFASTMVNKLLDVYIAAMKEKACEMLGSGFNHDEMISLNDEIIAIDNFKTEIENGETRYSNKNNLNTKE